MAFFIFLGYIVGLIAGGITVATLGAALGLPALVPPTLAPFVAPLLALLGPLSPLVLLILAAVVLVFFYLLGYVIATVSVAGSLPAGAVFPLATRFPAAAPTVLAATPGEFFARGMMIGETAVLNALPLALVPRYGIYLGPYAFIVISLAAIIFVARNRIYHGFLGWSAWLFPLSYLATAVGLLLFLVNAPFAFAASGIGVFGLDFTVGVVETSGGIVAAFFPSGGFSLGNFNFVEPAGTGGTFTTSSTSTHESGHTLNTAAFGGVVLWINAIDENLRPFRKINLAYGELTAEGHSQVMPPPTTNDFFIRLWV